MTAARTTIDGMHTRGEREDSWRSLGFDDASSPNGREAKLARARARIAQMSPAEKAALRRKLAKTRAAADRPARRQAREAASLGLTRDDFSKERERLKANKEFIRPVSTLDLDLSSRDLKPDYSLKKRDIAESPRRSRSGLKKPKKNHTKLKVFFIVLFLILGLGGGAFAIWGNNLISKLTGGKSGLFEFISAISSNVKLKADTNGRTNILIFGTSGYDMDGTIVPGEQHDGAQLTDSVMLMSVDQETKDVAMVSLPRDLYVGNTCTATGKVNEVYYCSNLYGEDEEGGAEALKTVIEEIFAIDIQYRVHVDWTALIQIVDGIGGITVTLDNDIEDDGWTGTNIKAGVPTALNGEKALGLARARHGTTMGDFTRGDSQQKILAAIQQKIIADGLDLGTGLNLIEAVGDNVRMDFTIEELKSVFAIAKDISLDSMRQIPLIDYNKGIYYLSTADMNGISYVVPAAGMRNYTQIQKYVHKMLSSNPAVREDATILVLNGSGINGLAMNEQAILNKEGYANVEIDTAPERAPAEGEDSATSGYPEKYYLYDISGQTPGTVSALKEHYKLDRVGAASDLPAGINTNNIDVVLILGAQNND